MSISLGLPPGTVPVKERKAKKQRQVKKDPKLEPNSNYLQMAASSQSFVDVVNRENPYEKVYLNKRPRTDFLINSKDEPRKFLPII